MVTSVVAKNAKTAKVKNKFVNERKFQKNTQLSFWWKAKSSIYAKKISICNRMRPSRIKDKFSRVFSKFSQNCPSRAAITCL